MPLDPNESDGARIERRRKEMSQQVYWLGQYVMESEDITGAAHKYAEDQIRLNHPGDYELLESGQMDESGGWADYPPYWDYYSLYMQSLLMNTAMYLAGRDISCYNENI